jgi:hypothetical protein
MNLPSSSGWASRNELIHSILSTRHRVSRCTHRMNRIGTRCQSAEPPQTSLGLPHPRIHLAPRTALIRNGKHHFPNPGNSVLRVFRHQFMEESGTASRHTGDENRSLNERGIQALQLPGPGAGSIAIGSRAAPGGEPTSETAPVDANPPEDLLELIGRIEQSIRSALSPRALRQPPACIRLFAWRRLADLGYAVQGSHRRSSRVFQDRSAEGSPLCPLILNPRVTASTPNACTIDLPGATLATCRFAKKRLINAGRSAIRQAARRAGRAPGTGTSTRFSNAHKINRLQLGSKRLNIDSVILTHDS